MPIMVGGTKRHGVGMTVMTTHLDAQVAPVQIGKTHPASEADQARRRIDLVDVDSKHIGET